MRDRAELEDIERDREETAAWHKDRDIVAEALDIASTEGGDQELIDKILDGLTGGEMHDQFVALVKDILITKTWDSVVVPYKFRELIEAAAVDHFWQEARRNVESWGDSSEYQ